MTNQALVVGELRAAFPTDQVVAEETSTVLRQDPGALQAVTEVVRREGVDTGGYSEEDVCRLLDHGRTRTYSCLGARVYANEYGRVDLDVLTLTRS